MKPDFTLLRLLLAESVVLGHFEVITGTAPIPTSGLSSSVAVQAFFVVSGWLVSQSYDTSSSTAAFFVRRTARLYPLYATVVIAQALVVIAICGISSAQVGELLRYVGMNLAFANFAQPSLLGFLDGARMPAINPSLWTLKIEVMFYLSMPLWAWLVRRWHWQALLALYLGSALFYLSLSPWSVEIAKQLPAQMRFFVAGMMCRALLNHVSAQGKSHPQHRWLNRRLFWVALALAAWLAAHRTDDGFEMALVQPLLVAAAVYAASLALPTFEQMPDLSFGVYLLHAPLIQVLQQQDWLPSGLPGLLLAITATTALAGVASHAIEQPAIRWGHRLSRRLSQQQAKHRLARTGA